MIRFVTIGGQKHKINQTQVLGAGGEGTVIRVGKQAVKIYHKYDKRRAAKLRDFTGHGFMLPSVVCSPTDLALDSQGRVVGFAMGLMTKGNEVVQQLSSKHFRKSNPRYHSQFITELFIQAYRTTEAIHKAGIVIGDYNDLGVLFSLNSPSAATYIDVDSFQFDDYPCMVGTENFLDPQLYNIDLAKKPYFKIEHDWYAFWCMFIKSLIMAHPYGGVHQTYKSIPQRALARVTVFDNSVKYPKPALSPDLLNDRLMEITHRIFGKGERFQPSIDVLEDFRDSLVSCNSCGTMHPDQRASCPQCTTINTQQIQRKVRVVKSPGKRTVNCEEMLATPGSFIWYKLYGRTIYAVAREKNTYVLYVKKPEQSAITNNLFSPKSTLVKFDMFRGRFLVVNQEATTDEILILDTFAKKPTGVARRIADEYQGERIFACSKDNLLRVQDGFLYRGDVNHLEIFAEKQIIAVMENQTWLAASPISSICFGFQRYFQNLAFFLVDFRKVEGGKWHDVKIPDLKDSENILDVDVQFSVASLLFLMKTEIKGKTFTRVFVIDQNNGNVRFSYSVEALSSDTHRNIHGKAFAQVKDTAIILHPTDDGIVQEVVGTNKQTLLPETEQFISESDHVFHYRNGILVAGDNIINFLTII